jgi:polysaccharide pyruvyl transferase WcaK-like protein
LLRSVCQKAIRAGFRVRHFPFTPEDNLYARIVLSGLQVEFLPYSVNINAVMSRMRCCERFFTSRFHSLVFSFLQSCEILPFCYAPKSFELLEDLHITHPSIFGIEHLFEDSEELADRIFDTPGLRVAQEVVAEACRTVTSVVDSAIGQVRRSIA